MFVAVTFATSCSLEENTTALSTPDNFFRKYSECQSVVNSCYIPLKAIYSREAMISLECVSDILWCGSGILDARLDISPAQPRFGLTMWKQCYNGVQRCNYAVRGIEEAYANKAITDEEYYDLSCEARTMRAFYYWHLTSFFGNVPFYFDDVNDEATLQRIALLPRMSAVDTRNTIIQDLMEVASEAKQVRTSDNPGNRAGASMAWMMIGKLAMWNQDWETAATALKNLEPIYGELSQYGYAENVMFRNKNTPESIFEIQHKYVQGGVIYTASVAAICTPTRNTTDGVTLYDGVQIPELGDEAQTWVSMRPNVYFSTNIQPKNSPDIRRLVNMAWEYNGQQFSSVSVRPWPGPKFWCPGMQSSYDSNNYKIFRYADALLMLAECYNEMDENDVAVSYLNKVRERAGTGEYIFKSSGRLREEIRKERARELFGEFQRKYDLVRWGIWYDSTVSLSDYDVMKGNILPCHEYYPIPDTEVTYSKYNLDNKAYEEYGL